jgi:hypothetical protein
MNLSRIARGEDTYSSAKVREESYKYLFPKIGRDFVARDDLKLILKSLANELGLFSPSTNFDYNGEAISIAHTYAEMIESGRGGAHSREDLINMDEEK